jgi:hypothetical protein
MLPLLLVVALGQPEAPEPLDPRLEEVFGLLRGQLTWHAPAAPPVREGRDKELRDFVKKLSSSPWQEALGPHPVQLADVPQALIEEVKKLARAHPDRPKVPDVQQYPWRLKDPAHPDVVKAIGLLEAIKDGPATGTARRWAAELRRNNTVLTFDVAGAYAAGQRARFILDARNVDTVTFKLYRLGTAEDVLRVLDRIGTDFIFRVHETERALERMKKVEQAAYSKSETRTPPLPDVLKEKPLASWEQPLDRVRRLPLDTLRDGYFLYAFEQEDSGRYDDECREHRERLERSYLPRDEVFSSWRVGLILEVSGEHLKQPGAYLLRVEANGQSALAPILVEPPALTLRRCPDGVFALVGTEGGKKPVAGATVQARKQVATVKTDREGVAFLRVFARGDRAIVAEHEGNFAVGGFGAVFAGIYLTPEDVRHRGRHARRDLKEGRERDEARLFADGLVVALWTDRPAYRPGEVAQGKLIVRRRVPRAGAEGFRAEEYDSPNLELLPEGTEVVWQLLDPERQVVADGLCKLNDYGTAQLLKMPLGEKGLRGPYLFRARLKEKWYLLPAVFVVDELFRAPGEVEITGLPAKLEPGCKLELGLVGRHGNGLPANKGQVTLALANATMRWNLTPDAITLDKQGKAKAEITLPRYLPVERLTLRATLSEAAGVTTTRAIGVEVAARAGPLLGTLPRFVPVEQVFLLKTTVAEIELEQGKRDDDPVIFRTTRVQVVGGQAKITFPGPGWYTVRAGEEEQEVFAYGGKEGPWTTCTRRQIQAGLRDDDSPGPWIDLAHFEDRHGENWNQAVPMSPLLAMIGAYEGAVGDSVSVLVYVPQLEARLLLTIEGHSVIDYLTPRVESEKSRYHVLKIPLRDRYAPHFYLQGCILNASDEGDEHLKDQLRKALEKLLEEDEGEDPEWCKITVQGAARSGGLKVALTADRSEYEPGERVTVEVRTTDAAGKPVAAEVALAAVDERLFAVAGDRLTGVVATLTGARAAERLTRKSWRSSPGVRPVQQRQVKELKKMSQEEAIKALEELRREDRERLVDRPGARPLDELGSLPVSVVPLLPVRDPVRETALWAPMLRTDAEGRARVEFTVPGNLTRYRISALGLTKSGLVGMGRTTFRASKRLEVEVLLPAELIVGQVVELPVQVRNATDQERQVELTTTLTGLEWPGNPPPRSRTVTVPPRGVTTVRLSVLARKEGAAGVRVQVADGPDDDAESRPIRVVVPPEKEPAEEPSPGM